MWVIILFSFFFFIFPASTRALAQLLALLRCHLTADGALHGGWHLQAPAFGEEQGSLHGGRDAVRQAVVSSGFTCVMSLLGLFSLVL